MMDSQLQDLTEDVDPVTILEAHRTQRKALLLMLFMVVGLNMSWLFAQSLSSDVELNKTGLDNDRTSTFEVPDMMLMSQEVPTIITCNTAEDPTKVVNSTAVSWRLTNSRGVLVHSWSGEVGEDCSVRLTLEPGLHRMITEVDDAIDIDQTVEMRVWGSLSSEGHITATVMGILFPLPAILAARRRGRRASRSTPLARMRRHEDWETIHREMEARDRQMAEVGTMAGLTSTANRIDQRLEKQAAAKEPELDHDIKDVPAIDQTDLLEDMSRQTLRGLEDPLSADDRIKRVGDIYNLMKDD